MTALKPAEHEQARMVGRMFDRIAHRYDLMNRLMSAGQDARWRRAAAASLGDLRPGPLLDIGVGTGDLALTLLHRYPDRQVVGIDLSSAMMAVARAKAVRQGQRRLALARADTLRLPFADGAFAGAATAFTLRNVASVPTALAEIRRVLRPGAPFACLEITRPRGVLAWPFLLYFHQLVPFVGGLISGQPAAYRYLPTSVDRFLTDEGLAQTIRAAGFGDVRSRRFWPGSVTLHTGRAEEPPHGIAR